MCLITYATDTPSALAITASHVERAWRDNPHGLGIAWREDASGPIKVRKGYMTLPGAIAAVQRIQKREPVEMAIHWRFGTSGGITRTNTHPFRVRHGALLHNGILTLPGTATESDTRRAARLTTDLRPSVAAEILESWRGSSRLLFLADKPSQSWRRGDWIESNVPGLLLSQGYSLPDLVPASTFDDGSFYAPRRPTMPRRVNLSGLLGKSWDWDDDKPLTPPASDEPTDVPPFPVSGL